ncbi:MAG: ShlB/FhaC/HecB family hemolysin secretion/activation protein [Phycisphaeraceae bacterium]
MLSVSDHDHDPPARPARRLYAVAAGLLAVAFLFAPVRAAPEPALSTADEADGPAFTISRFKLQHLHPHPQLPDDDWLAQVKVRLGVVEDGFVAPRASVPHVEFRLAEPETWPSVERYYASGLQAILEQLRDALLDEGVMAVSVAPDPTQIDEAGRDLRDEDEHSLTLLVSVGRATELRTLARGERFEDEEALEDRPEHARIRRHSPVQPWDGEGAYRDLLHERAMDEYAHWLSRQPGRRVDAVLAPAEELGGVSLGYIVTEAKPWAIYAQTSNTGTRQTKEWRQQFGFFHNQLTNNDDVLSLQYLTAGFDDLHAVAASYEAPLGSLDRVRWRVEGTFSDFTASDVGLFRDSFEGTSWSGGGELSANVYQHRDLFVDLFAGGRYLDVDVESTVPGMEGGHEQFVLPRAGVRVDRRTRWYYTDALGQVEWQTGDVTGVDQAEIDQLGRPSPDRNWTTLQWRVGHAFFLEPLIHGEAWLDPDSPERSTMAHEISLAFRGQHALGSRLIPQVQQVAGGLYTVRGYPESIVAGDTVYIGRAEYRFHLPRAFPLETETREFFGQPFRFAPQYVAGPTDWDLSLRTFLDVGHVRRSSADGMPDEASDTLVGTGVGLDFGFRRNVRVGVDWGIALRDTASGEVTRGSNRFHFNFTLLY